MAMQADKISSKAVVKYELNPVFTSYKQLEKYTDLNLPPSNWLKDNLIGRFSDSIKKKKVPVDYSSLLMAHRYPEAIGEVDVVSGADHIKKLLKIPFSTKELSLTVNRIGKSLLLNDIDIPALLRSNDIAKEHSDLTWLRQLYCAAIDAPEDSEVYPKKHNKEETEIQKILSKFMHHSIEHLEEKNDEGVPLSSNSTALVEPVCCQPVSQRQNVTDSSSGIPAEFHRDILWNFEDITMLVGSDLPIFGGGKYPTVSLRLRDSTKPVNILTGIDYWLDNLMCNVPEILMCYHSKGIVQRYEKINTTDLPSLDGSSFSPKIIKDTAQNILSFLKSNCTKEGHTYWLFKSNKDDVIKLYDLTSICDQNKNISNHNPFSISVGMLLYKIACNMYNANEVTKNNIHRVKSLLQQSIQLLDKEKQHMTTFWANYLLLNIMTKPIKDGEDDEISFDDIDDDSDSDEASESENLLETDPIKTVSVKALCIPSDTKRRQSTTMENTYNKIDEDNKNKNILTKIISTLKSLSSVVQKRNSLPAIQSSPEKVVSSVENPKYIVSKSQRPVNLLKCSSDVLPIPFNSVTTISLAPIQSMLILKAVTAYLNLVNLNISNLKFGRSLRFLKICSLLLYYIDEFESDDCAILKIKTHMFFGDVLTMMAKEKINVAAEKLDFTAYNQNDADLINLVEYQATDQFFLVDNVEDCFDKKMDVLLSLAADIYELGLSETGKDQDDSTVSMVIDLTRRLGNIRNELGVFYMNKAAGLVRSYGLPTDQEIAIWRKGFSFFERAIQAFEIVNDWSNVVLLYSNSARLMRLCAQVYGFSTRASLNDSRGQFIQQEKTCFHKAFEFYLKALSLLESKKIQSTINNNVCVELSAAYFTMANLMQDYAPLNSMAEETVVKEISGLLMKSMHYCEIALEESLSEQTELLTLRLGMIHQRLASLYHHVLRNQISDHGKRNYRSLSELHYKKSYQYVEACGHYIEFLKLFVEYTALYEYLLKQNISQKSIRSKFDLFVNKDNKLVVALMKVLGALDNSKDVENHSNINKKECINNKDDIIMNKDGSENSELDIVEITKIIDLLEKQMTITFKEILKFTSTQKFSKGYEFIKKDLAKKLLEIVLRGLVTTELDLSKRVMTLVNVLSSIYDVYTAEHP